MDALELKDTTHFLLDFNYYPNYQEAVPGVILQAWKL